MPYWSSAFTDSRQAGQTSFQRSHLSTSTSCCSQRSNGTEATLMALHMVSRHHEGLFSKMLEMWARMECLSRHLLHPAGASHPAPDLQPGFGAATAVEWCDMAGFRKQESEGKIQEEEAEQKQCWGSLALQGPGQGLRCYAGTHDACAADDAHDDAISTAISTTTSHDCPVCPTTPRQRWWQGFDCTATYDFAFSTSDSFDRAPRALGANPADDACSGSSHRSWGATRDCRRGQERGQSSGKSQPSPEADEEGRRLPHIRPPEDGSHHAEAGRKRQYQRAWSCGQSFGAGKRRFDRSRECQGPASVTMEEFPSAIGGQMAGVFCPVPGLRIGSSSQHSGIARLNVRKAQSAST